MPVYNLSQNWSDPIALAAGDIVQNPGRAPVEIVVSDPDADPARLRLPPVFGSFQVERATTIRARSTARVRPDDLHVIRGF